MTLRGVFGGDVQHVQVFGLVLLPPAVVAGLLVVYFEWRAKLRRRVLGERDTYRKAA